MVRRWLPVAMLAAGTAACDIGPATRTRVDAALLTKAELTRAQQAQGAQRTSPTERLTGGCAQVEGLIAQLQVMGGGRLRFSGTGQLDLPEEGWTRLPAAQRNVLLRTLAAQNRCKTGAEKGTGIIRNAAGTRVIERYREA